MQNRRHFLISSSSATIAVLASGLGGVSRAFATEDKVVHSDTDWRKLLTPDQYAVLRKAGTERPFSSQMCGLFEPGIYSCLCCDTILFDASEKFESGTGWPSFTQPIETNVIAYHFDGPAFLQRVETVCNTCDAHLGHVFPDGPAPSGLRYCMNAVALKKTGANSAAHGKNA